MGSALLKDASGWTIFPYAGALRHRGYSPSVPADETMSIYVSDSMGNDNGDGSPGNPYKTILKGASMLRDGSPDWLQLRVGDYFANQSVCTNSTGMSYWTKSGRNPGSPMVIGQWHPNRVDEPNVGYSYGARPIVDPTPRQHVTTFQATSPSDNVWITGIESYPSNTDPSSPNFDINAIYGDQLAFSSGQNSAKTSWGAEDCKLQFGGGDGMFCEHQDNVTSPGIAVYRNVIRFVWGNGAHTWGAAGLQDWRENLIDHCGCGDGSIPQYARGWNSLLHNMYFSGWSMDDQEHPGGDGNLGWFNEFNGNICARESYRGAAQFRAGGRIVNNLLIEQCMLYGCFLIRGVTMPDIDKLYIAYNLSLRSGDSCWQLAQNWDYAEGKVLIEKNIASTTDATTQHYNPFIRSETNSVIPNSHVTVRNNIIWRWVDKGPLSGGGWVIAGFIDWQVNNRWYNPEFQPVNNFGFPNPNYTMADFMNAHGWTGEDHVNFLNRAALQQKGRWDNRLTAAYVNDWFRTVAFNEPAYTPRQVTLTLKA